jgi:vacuolar-type H+-ATPase subunit D/Vma8
MNEEEKFIQMTLDERERADHFRLKLVKNKLGKKRGEG